jgi:molybdopterin molybdotransferase
MPWLAKSVGIPSTDKVAQLGADIRFPKDLSYFAQVTLTLDQGRLIALPVEGNGSGDLANLSDADAFMELPRGKDIYKKGEIYKIFPYRSLNVI